MNKVIISIEKDWIVFAYGIIGTLLIIFPIQLTDAIPYLLGFALIVHGIVSIIILAKFKGAAKVTAGKILIDLILGNAILYHGAGSLGAIGALWAMMTLDEVADEVTEAYRNKTFPIARLIFAAIAITLAILLLFDPFENFALHVRILGLEVVASVFVRERNLIQKDSQKNSQEDSA